MEILESNNKTYKLRLECRNKKGRYEAIYEVTDLGIDLSNYASIDDINFILSKFDGLVNSIENSQIKTLQFNLLGVQHSINNKESIEFKINLYNSYNELLRTISFLNGAISTNMANLQDAKNVINVIIPSACFLSKHNETLNEKQLDIIDEELLKLIKNFNNSIDYQISESNFKNMDNFVRYSYNEPLLFKIIGVGAVLLGNYLNSNDLEKLKIVEKKRLK